MNRRGFLGSLLALGAAALAPITARTEWIRARFITRAVVLNEEWMCGVEPAAGDGFYVAFVHPSLERELREVRGRYRWEAAWRRYRIARREGVEGEMVAIEVLERFAEPAYRPEIGTLGGLRIIPQGVPA